MEQPMNEWIQYILPLPTGGLLRTVYTWLCDAVFWGVFAVYAGALFYSIVFSARAEKTNDSTIAKLQGLINTKLFNLAWAPMVVTLLSGVALALLRLSVLDEKAMSTGVISFAMGLIFVLIGFWLQNISVLAHAKGPTSSGKEQGLKFTSPAFMYSTYASIMSLGAGSLLVMGAETWCMDEKLWNLGFFGSFSSMTTWFMWFVLLAAVPMVSAAFLIVKANDQVSAEEAQSFNQTLASWTSYAAYALPVAVVSAVLAISNHALSLVVVVFSVLTLISAYALWHLNLHRIAAKSFFCVNLGALAFVLCFSGLFNSPSSYGVRDAKLDLIKADFKSDLMIRTYLDTAKVDSTKPPLAHEKSPYFQVQLKH